MTKTAAAQRSGAATPSLPGDARPLAEHAKRSSTTSSRAGHLPRLRKRLAHLAECLRYEEAAPAARSHRGRSSTSWSASADSTSCAPWSSVWSLQQVSRAGERGVLRQRRRSLRRSLAAAGRARGSSPRSGSHCRAARVRDDDDHAEQAEDCSSAASFAVHRPSWRVLPLDTVLITSHLAGNRLRQAAIDAGLLRSAGARIASRRSRLAAGHKTFLS